MKKLFGAVVALVAFGGSAFAEDAVTPVDAMWINTKDAAPEWMTLANWTDGEGAAIARPPTNVADTVTFPVGPIADANHQTIKLDVGNTATVRKEIGLGSLVDENPDLRHVISLAGRYASYCWEGSVWLTLCDPNRFNGYITAYDAAGSGTGTPGFGIRLPATVEKPLTLAGVSLAQHVDVQVPTAGTKATIDELYESGTLRKIGAGELVVKGTDGAGTTIYVTQGALTLNGHASAAAMDEGDDVPVAGAWIHLDANNPDTLKTYYDRTDGRTYVTNWADVRGEGRPFAFFNDKWTSTASYKNHTSHAPFVNGSFASGKTVVDFGRRLQTEDPALGPTNCWLQLSSETKIRELFVVSACYPGNGGSSCVGNITDGSAYYNFVRSNYNLASKTYGKPLVYGDIIIDGARKDNSAIAWSTAGLNVVSVGATNAVFIGALGTDRQYNQGASQTGGWRIAEVIAFTNELTGAERMSVHRYLQRKWTARERSNGPCEVGAVTLASGENPIAVPEGRTAVVQEVNAFGGTLVKKGEGTLVVGSLASSKAGTSVKVDVQAGEVKFGGLAAVDDSEPAADPWLWLKAERQYMTFAAKENDSKEYISKWADCRAGQTTRYGEQTADTEQPYLLENAVGDLASVHFGDKRASGLDSGAYWMNIKGGDRKVYDGFVVHCDNTTAGGEVFSTVNQDFARGGMNRFIHAAADAEIGWSTGTPYGGPTGRNAQWTANGVVVDPAHPGQINRVKGEWNVFGVSTTFPFNGTLLGDVDRKKVDYGGGGCQIGEVVYYDRKLSPDERRQTIAYLMKKWLDKVPAFAADSVRVERLAFADGEDAVIDTDRTLEVEDLSWSGGALVKRGTGAFGYPACASQLGAQSIAVEGGSLALPGNPLEDILSRTAIHFDASAAETIIGHYETEEDGVVVTNVTQVTDVNKPSLTAKPWINDNYYVDNVFHGICFTNPTLRVVETADGVSMPVFDFGHQNGYHETKTKEERYHDASCLRFTSNAKILEVHEIFADILNGGNTTIISDGSKYNYLRGSNKGLIASGYDPTKLVIGGVIELDGTNVAYNAKAPAGLHLYSFAPTNVTTVGAMGDDRNIFAGGCQVGELIAFETPLSADERAYLQGCLMAKWLGRDVPVWTNALESLTVAAGASLSIGTDDTIVAESIDGSGTVKAGAVLATGSLDLVADKPLVVDGTFAQGGALAVTVACAYNPDVGDYPILTADALENVDLSTWTLSVTLSRMRTAKLVRKGNTVYLSVERTGALIIIR